MEVRRVRAGDGPRLRAVRLRALLDSPTAFGAGYDEDAARTDEQWEALTARAAAGHEHAIWLDEDGEATHAMTGAAAMEGGRPGEYVIWGMWVAPEARRTGLGAQLLQEGVDWSWDAGARLVTLWVVDDNQPARALYERAGFVQTDVSQPLPSHPHLLEWLLEKRRPEGK